jgi:hypothetical protein
VFTSVDDRLTKNLREYFDFRAEQM